MLGDLFTTIRGGARAESRVGLSMFRLTWPTLILWLAYLIVVPCCVNCFGANVALWSQTSPAYVPTSSNIRDHVAVWPPAVARNLTYYTEINAPTAVAATLQEVLRDAMSVWESAADIQFVSVWHQRDARLVITVDYQAGSGHYHGGGNAWPPVRRADGTFQTSHVNLFYSGEPDPASPWNKDSWVWMAVHELGHALGLWHEFQRSDASQYMRALPEQSLLPAIENERGYTADTSFDCASVMMYAWTDNDRNPYFYIASPGTVPLPLPTVNFYQRNGLSPGDIEIIQWLYGEAPNQQPVVHQNPLRDDTLLAEWENQGWSVVDSPGMEVYGCDGWVVMEAEYGVADHWSSGGNPPRLERCLESGHFEMSVEVTADYVPFGTHAEVFVILGPQDWIYFGPYENPRQICAQRTGRAVSPMLLIDSNCFQLHVLYRNGRLDLTCVHEAKTYEVAVFADVAAPERLGIGVKTWGSGEFGYRCLHFRDLSLSALPPEALRRLPGLPPRELAARSG